MTGCEPGDIVLVRFPFTDLSSVKKRPGIVVSPASYARRFGDVVVLALTSQDQGDPSLLLVHWQTVGLPKPTWIKPLIGTLSSDLVERQIGRIDPRDSHCVRAAFAMLLSPNWNG
jgi:mRNA interferase MazF